MSIRIREVILGLAIFLIAAEAGSFLGSKLDFSGR
jgi:hypothetical protein